MPRRTPAPPGRIFWCSDRASVSPTPFRSAARRGETSRSCPTVLPGRRCCARAVGRSAPSGPSPRRSHVPYPTGWPCALAAAGCVRPLAPGLPLPSAVPSPAGPPGESTPPPQPSHHLGHGQHHLHRRIFIRGHCLELPHSSLRFNLIWFLHSDSPFSRQKKIALSLSRLRAESRYLLRSIGHSRVAARETIDYRD